MPFEVCDERAREMLVETREVQIGYQENQLHHEVNHRWMRLPTETVPASYSEVFKTCLDKVLNVLVRAVFALNSSLG